ncbi:hypothetical protein CRUP_010306 [Coryphaenoides rupestris]|nr:hypothetical protein CRUP_010306 [Coryphaenoides rupestris]
MGHRGPRGLQGPACSEYDGTTEEDSLTLPPVMRKVSMRDWTPRFTLVVTRRVTESGEVEGDGEEEEEEDEEAARWEGRTRHQTLLGGRLWRRTDSIQGVTGGTPPLSAGLDAAAKPQQKQQPDNGLNGRLTQFPEAGTVAGILWKEKAP